MIIIDQWEWDFFNFFQFNSKCRIHLKLKYFGLSKWLFIICTNWIWRFMTYRMDLSNWNNEKKRIFNLVLGRDWIFVYSWLLLPQRVKMKMLLCSTVPALMYYFFTLLFNCLLIRKMFFLVCDVMRCCFCCCFAFDI